MSEAFHQKLAFVLKALSISRGALAAGLGIDKSAVGRWVSGQVEPSAHNLARLSAYVAGRVPGFTALDGERSQRLRSPNRLCHRPAHPTSQLGYLMTKFTILPGTTITFATVLPAIRD